MARTIQQKIGEDRLAYLSKMRRYAKRQFDLLRDDWEFKHCHESFAVCEALKRAESVYVDSGTFGVEGDCEQNGEGRITIDYLNTGEQYELTVCHYRGRFVVACIDDIIERATRGRRE